LKIDSKKIVEALIFTAPEPITDAHLAKTAGVDKQDVIRLIDELNSSYEHTGRSFRIKKIAGGYHFYALPEFSEFIDEAFPDKKYPQLTRAVIEVLAVIAMEQPIHKKYIEKIRGTACDAQIKRLLELGFITPVSRMNTPGRPYLLATTHKFLKHFGLGKVEDIPNLDELKELLD
jgi:segregation and condensation protein B